MPEPVQVIPVGKWEVGYSKAHAAILLLFKFSDHEPINLALSRAEAEGLAKEILDRLEKFPTAPNQMN